MEFPVFLFDVLYETHLFTPLPSITATEIKYCSSHLGCSTCLSEK